MTKKRPKGNFFIKLGLLFLLGALGLTCYNIKEADDADKAAQDVVSQLKEIIDPKIDVSPAPLDEEQPAENEVPNDSPISIPAYDPLPTDREIPTIQINQYYYIGYLTVPSIDLTLPVMDTWDYDRLKISPCRYSGSLYTNDLVIAGHNYRRHFSPLRYLNPGTQILFTDVDGVVYHYHISDLVILKPDQTAALTTPSDDWDLTLFTCTIGGQTRHTIRCVRDF